jgi:predicted ATPase
MVSELKQKPDIMSESTSEEIDKNQPIQITRLIFDRDIQENLSLEGITRISVSGYKSLYEECSIEVRPLTILAGANSSGKSSMMQPLLLLKQTLEATYDPGALLLDGPNVRFTLASQLFSQIPGKNSGDRLSVNLQINDESLITTFKKEQEREIEVISTTCKSRQQEFTVLIGMNGEDVAQEFEKWFNDDEIWSKLFANTEQEIKYNIVRSRCFLHINCQFELPHEKLGIVNFTIYDSRSHTSLFESEIRRLIHIPALRGNPERAYKTTAVEREFTGTFENYVASIINRWQKTEDNRLLDLAKSLQKLGLTWKVDAKQINDVQIELRVARLPRRNEFEDMVNLADVGFGVSQTLPVLVALLVAKPGQLVYLEQPEIHLHPRAQAALAEVLADAANRGVKVVVETHSELLLLAVQSLVAEGKLSPDLVKLHWFRRREDGVTEVSSADLDEAGAFGDWPEDFGDVSLKLENRYLDAAEAHLWKR